MRIPELLFLIINPTVRAVGSTVRVRTRIEVMFQMAPWPVAPAMADSVLFFLAQVSQISIEGLRRFIGCGVLVFNAGDDPDRATAAATELDSASGARTR